MPRSKKMTLVVSGLLLLVLAAGLSMLGRPSALVHAEVATSGTGGKIYFGAPKIIGGDLAVPVLTTTATDPYSAANIAFDFDTTLVHFKSPDTTGSVFPGAVRCASALNAGQGAVTSCTPFSPFQGTTAAGLLFTLIFSGDAGCTNLHIVTLNTPDDGGLTFGSYTLNAADQMPQGNVYGHDVTADTRTAFQCRVVTPTSTLTTTSTLTATLTPIATATATATAAQVPCAIRQADVDGDGVVSILDLAAVAIYFGQSVPPAPAAYDQDGDHVISILDLTWMAQVFTQPVSACP
jgi:Dockerin type I domain